MILVYILCLVAIFFFAGVNKVNTFAISVKDLKTRQIFRYLPHIFSTLAIVTVVVLEILAPIFMIYGLHNSEYKIFGYYSCLGLIVFTILATLLYHNPLYDESQKIPFLKNISIIGGLGCALYYY